MTGYFNNFYLRGRTDEVELGLLLIKRQSSFILERCLIISVAPQCPCLCVQSWLWVALLLFCSTISGQSDYFWYSVEIVISYQLPAIRPFYPACCWLSPFSCLPRSLTSASWDHLPKTLCSQVSCFALLRTHSNPTPFSEAWFLGFLEWLRKS